MHNPYAERLYRAFLLLKERGLVRSQNKFSAAIGIPSNHFPAVKRGERSITLENITNLCLTFGVSTTYMVLGIEPIMEPKPRKLSETEQTELERKLARAEATVQLQEKIIQAKDQEIAFYRELLRQDKERKGDS